METRKVQITGKSTFIISLPKTWVTKSKIHGGDSIMMIPRSDGTLLINPKFHEKDEQIKRSVTIELKDEDELVRKFIGAYLAGNNIIEIKSKDGFLSSEKKIIRKITHNVIGPEIIDETTDLVTIKDLLDSSDFSLLKGIKRMHLITRSMHKDAVLALKEKNIELAKDVEERDDEVDKFYWMVAKQYNLVLNDIFFADKMNVTPQEMLGYLLIARSIERIADHAKRMAFFTQRVKGNLEIIQKICEASEKITEVFDDSINFFKRNNFDDANDVVNKAKKLGKLTDNLTQKMLSLKLDAESIVSLTYIVDSLERTRAYVLDIAETSINHYFVIKNTKK